MIKNICLLLILILLTHLPAIGTTSPMILKGKEVVWSGEVELKSDLVIPEGTTLTIMPGTRIYGIYEYNKKVFTPKEWKIIVKGNLIALGKPEKSVIFDPVPTGLSSIKIPLDPKIENIIIAPKKIDTKEIRDEFAVFRTQYIALWVFLFAAIYYAVKTK